MPNPDGSLFGDDLLDERVRRLLLLTGSPMGILEMVLPRELLAEAEALAVDMRAAPGWAGLADRLEERVRISRDLLGAAPGETVRA